MLLDGRLELSNNVAERAVKPFVIGHKNWFFSDTPKGAEASAGIYSLVNTAKLNGLNPRAYLEWLLTKMPNTENLEDDTILDGFLPWSKSVPEGCFMSKEAFKKVRKQEDDPIVDIDPQEFEEIEKTCE